MNTNLKHMTDEELLQYGARLKAVLDAHAPLLPDERRAEQHTLTPERRDAIWARVQERLQEGEHG